MIYIVASLWSFMTLRFWMIQGMVQRRVILVEGNIERKIYDSYTRLTSSKRIQAQTDTLPNLIFMRHGKKEVEGEGNRLYWNIGLLLYHAKRGYIHLAQSNKALRFKMRINLHICGKSIHWIEKGIRVTSHFLAFFALLTFYQQNCAWLVYEEEVHQHVLGWLGLEVWNIYRLIEYTIKRERKSGRI